MGGQFRGSRQDKHTVTLPLASGCFRAAQTPWALSLPVPAGPGPSHQNQRAPCLRATPRSRRSQSARALRVTSPGPRINCQAARRGFHSSWLIRRAAGAARRGRGLRGPGRAGGAPRASPGLRAASKLRSRSLRSTAGTPGRATSAGSRDPGDARAGCPRRAPSAAPLGPRPPPGLLARMQRTRRAAHL